MKKRKKFYYCNKYTKQKYLISYVTNLTMEYCSQQKFIDLCEKCFYYNYNCFNENWQIVMYETISGYYGVGFWFRTHKPRCYKHVYFSDFVWNIIEPIITQYTKKYLDCGDLALKIKQLKTKYRLADLEHDFI